MVIIYILELEQGKFYVGKTTNLKVRLSQHFKGEGCEWTKKYKPIKLHEKINGDDYDEDKYTKIYMDKYGIDNVRGGMYSKIVLDDNDIKHLNASSTSTNDRCFHCDQSGHYAAQCPNVVRKPVIDNNKKENVTYNNISKKENDHLIGKNNKKENLIICDRCGRDHKKENCYATYHKDGHLIACERCGYDHNKKDCYATYHKDGYLIIDEQAYTRASETNVCSRCLKKGHYRIDCYEKFDINNKQINDSCIIS